jgi:hypothetical protein
MMILAAAERKLGVAEKLAAVICDPRDPLRVVHLLPVHSAGAHLRHCL